MPAQQVIHRGDGEVAEVLVVDGVELAVVDQVAHVGELDHGHAVVLQQGGDAGHEAVGVGHVGQDVVGVDDVAFDARLRQLTQRTALAAHGGAIGDAVEDKHPSAIEGIEDGLG